MPRYTVTWGDDEKVVTAENETDAWSEFAKGHDLAYRCPHLRERTIEVVDEYEESNPEL